MPPYTIINFVNGTDVGTWGSTWHTIASGTVGNVDYQNGVYYITHAIIDTDDVPEPPPPKPKKAPRLPPMIAGPKFITTEKPTCPG